MVPGWLKEGAGRMAFLPVPNAMALAVRVWAMTSQPLHT